MEQTKRYTLLRTLVAGTLLLTGIALYQMVQAPWAAGILFISRRWMAVFLVGILGLIVEMGLLASSWTPRFQAISTGFDALVHILGRLKLWNLGLFGLAIGLFSFLLIGRYGLTFEDVYLRLFLFWLVVLAGSVFLKASGLQRGWVELLGASLLVAAAGYKAASFLTDISNYPFTMGWSEASRFYYASLFFSRQVYGIQVPPSVLHPSRYLMQSAPFLIPNSPIWVHRLWQVVLWVGVTLITSYCVARRLAIPGRVQRWLLVALAFIFLLVGPVYYHLQVPLILVLLTFDRRRFWKTLVGVLLASIWAGISRINWFPVPGMLAALLYFLEQPAEKRSFWRYLIPPFLWTVTGTGLAFAVQAIYVAWSGNPRDQFTSSFTSDLLWYRLFPNPTYPTGILLAVLLVSFPLVLIILARLAGRWKAYHPIRLLGMAAILLALLGGGLIVSTKIGGGSNLHNLDAYLSLLFIAAAYFYFGRDVSEPGPEAGMQPVTVSPASSWMRIVFAAGLLFSLVVPAYYSILSGGPVFLPSAEQTQADLETLTRQVTKASGQGKVLFIGERQLLTFHYVSGIALVPDYERVFLMEMAMAANPQYLGKFHAQLKNHEFAMIVSDPIFTQFKGSDYVFGEENNAWVNQVSKYVICYYEPQKLLKSARVQMLVPRAEAQPNCP